VLLLVAWCRHCKNVLLRHLTDLAIRVFATAINVQKFEIFLLYGNMPVSSGCKVFVAARSVVTTLEDRFYPAFKTASVMLSCNPCGTNTRGRRNRGDAGDAFPSITSVSPTFSFFKDISKSESTVRPLNLEHESAPSDSIS
jgi:hypothetical protein